MLPKSIQNLIEAFQLLPGIGARSAERLTFYLLNAPDEEIEKIADSLGNLKKSLTKCKICQNITETSPCNICNDNSRDQSIICVVENPLDVIAFEKVGNYKGVYHVLGGALSPMDSVGPSQLALKELFERAQNSASELILATNPTLEGEATAMFISKELESLKDKLHITRIARGLPTGADIEYADEMTLRRALEGRREY